MSTNCIRCVVNKRTDIDLLCDECRAAEAPERASRILLAPAHGSETRLAALLKMKAVIESGWAGVNKLGHIVDRREVPDAVPIAANKMFNTPEPKSPNVCVSDDL